MEAMNQDNNTLTHITHLHPLHLVEVTATASPPACHACGFLCTDSSIYRCAPCRYVMHVACARAAKTLQHAAHPDHPLSFRLAPPPPLEHKYRGCDACGRVINGPSYRCVPCEFDLHLPCAALPDAITVDAHAHPLKLKYDDPLKERSDFPSLCICDVCSEGCSTAQWFYWCEKCDFGAHVGCAVPDMVAKILYPAIDVAEIQRAASAAAAAAEAAKTAALLQQYQQMSALISAQSSAFAMNTASIAAGMQSMAVRASDHNLEINFNKSGTQQENRKREEHYAQRRSYSK
ncbi:unnamed protein product [Alopecurus aequalis]